MPLITNKPRRNGSLIVTEFVDSVGTSDVTFSIPDNIQQEALQIHNISPIELLVSVGTQSNISVPPYQGVALNEVYTSFSIKSSLGVGGFRATCSYEDSDEEDEVILGDRINQLTTQLSQSTTIKGTTQSIIFNSNGTVQKVQHKDSSSVVIREDIFTYAKNLITEVRTLSSGGSVTFKYHLDTLETEVI